MSLLRPGKVPKVVAALRAKTMRELAAPDPNSEKAKVDFEVEHKPVNLPEFNQDDNFVASFPGVWDPWVGNGRLPW